MLMRFSLSSVLMSSLLVGSAGTASADECLTKSCVSVTADDESDELIVTFHKPGTSRAGESTYSRERSKSRTSGSISAIADPDRTWIPYHPDLYAAWRESARKAAATRAQQRDSASRSDRTRLVTASLTDRVTQLVPFGTLQTQPSNGAVIGRPVYFWTPTPTSFDVTIRVGGVPVSLELTPTFEWSYGDGSPETIRRTSLPGAPYPVPINTFTYLTPGEKHLSLTTHWSGTFTVAGVKAPISGKITQRSSKTLFVHVAPHRMVE